MTGDFPFALKGGSMNRPWMPLYVADYRADTAHLDTAQHGAYLLLIMHYWQTGGLPDDDAQLARITCMKPAEWRRARPVIRPFFGDGWKHKRIEFELTEAARISAAGRAGGVASGKARREARDQRSANDQPTIDERSFNDPGTIGEALPSPSQRKKDSADAAPSGGKYEFESGIIRLTEKHFNEWKQAFSYLDLRAELTALAPWAGQQGPQRWFHAVSNALNKRNREAKIAAEKQQQQPFKWNGMEGVI